MTNKPFRIPSGPSAYFDVDDTLVQWKDPAGAHSADKIAIPFKDHTNYAHVNVHNVELLKKFCMRGHAVIVWSAGGVDWAEAVVKALGLEQYVHAVLSKPTYHIDDISDPAHILGRRTFIKFDGTREC